MILTKEQCLSEELNPQSSAIDLSNPHLRDAIFYAMQLYAKEIAIEFWRWWQRSKYSGYKKSDNDDGKTIQELFELFLQSINQK